MSILNVKLLQLFIMEMRTLACGFVCQGVLRGYELFPLSNFWLKDLRLMYRK